MENSELLNISARYAEIIKERYPWVESKRFSEEEENPLMQTDATASHALFMVEKLGELIETGEKQERIHRHYGFLQALVLILIPHYSLGDIMRDNKFEKK